METTTLPTAVDECISYARAGIAPYSGIQRLITETDFAKWKVALQDAPDVETYLWGSPEAGASFNLFNVAVLTGFARERLLAQEVVVHAQRLLERLDWFIHKFPGLTTTRRKAKQFAHKVKNLGEFQLLPTLSELTLAHWFKQQGFSVEFETPFRHPVTGNLKDADLTVTGSAGSLIHIDVYTPNKRLESDGFVGLDDESGHYVRKIELKIKDKFGPGTISDLSGKIMLAVNQVYFDAVHLQAALAGLGHADSYEEIVRRLPLDTDGILIFEDDFSRSDSFVFKAIHLKSY